MSGSIYWVSGGGVEIFYDWVGVGVFVSINILGGWGWVKVYFGWVGVIIVSGGIV